MTFNVKLDNQPEKFLKKADRILQDRIHAKITALQNDPFPHDSKRIVNRREKTFRIRVGDYRILYVVYFEENTILISKIDKRKNVY